MLRGLFIGIDRYRAPVTRLSCSRADALALSALFKDNFDGEVDLVLDEEANLNSVKSALNKLQQAAAEDLVVITFSGHGTENHELVPADVDPGRLGETCLSLEGLAQILDRIPAKQLLVILDCCFSGGFGGARVFAPVSSRNPVEDRQLVAGLVRGQGRVVITASGAGEPALETSEFGHGLLTYHILDGLQGAGASAVDGKISLYSLLDFVTRNVLATASRLGEVQTPTVYGSVEGAPTLNVLRPGLAYAAAFPSRVRPPVTEDWASLAAYGLPQLIVDAWAATMPTINELQRQAINDHGVLDGRSLLVSAPTGSGKTMIGELAAVRAAMNGARAVLLLPLKALVNDKYEYLTTTYGDLLTVVRATGEHSDQVGAIFSGQYDLGLLTYEKFMNLAIGNPFILRGISLVVVDEVQTISDPNRGPALEFLMTLLRSGHSRGGAPQIIALSAVIGGAQDFDLWLGASLLKTSTRPVPLRELVVDSSGSVQCLEADGAVTSTKNLLMAEWVSGGQGSKQLIIPLVRKLVSEGKKVIVFRETRGETVGTARYLAAALGLPGDAQLLERLPVGDLSASSQDLRTVVAAGVAFHNSDLDRDERFAIEESFRVAGSPLRVMVATTTLAMGVNTPAEAVVIAGLTHPGGQPYSVAEYKNMAGRAGRLGHVQAGEAYILAASGITPREAWERYVMGAPDGITSHFLAPSTDPQTLILRTLTALGSSATEQALVEILDNSFAVWSLRERGAGTGWDRVALRRDIDALVVAELLDRESDDRLTLTELGRYAGSSGIEVRSVTQVSSALRFAPSRLSFQDLVFLAQLTLELDALYLPVHRKSKQEQQRWPATVAQLGVASSLLGALHVGGGDPLQRAKRTAGCLFFASEYPLALIEQRLMQHMRDRSTAGPLRQIAARTRDVIDSVATIARVKGHPLADDLNVDDVTIRLEFGLPQDCLELAQILGGALTRAQYLALRGAGIVTGAAFASADSVQLAKIIDRPVRLLKEAIRVRSESLQPR